MKRGLLILTSLIFSIASNGQNFPARFSRVIAANNISNPTAFAFAPDGRIFISEQSGKLRVVKNGSLLPTAFVSLTVDSNGERGLLGIAFDPDFITNGFIYLYYTSPNPPIHNRISRFKANGDVSDGTEVIILDLDPLSSATNHNGGAISFGSDSKLYVAIGENADGSHSQDLDTYHGKMLRINSDGSVPAGNPFTGSEQRKRVWSYGLRNPFTFSFQPLTGKLFINDVGQNSKEEINDGTTGGLNFGWPAAEGQSGTPGFTNPLFTYDHGSGDGKGCAITGGTFFNPTTTVYPPMYVGKYFYQDLCNNWINYIDVSGVAQRFEFATNVGGQSLALSTGPDGNLYYLCRTDGALYKIVYDNTGAPVITTQPVVLSINQNQPASFSVVVSGTPTISYQWKKNNVDIPNATSSTYSIASAQPSDNGSYKVLVSNSIGEVTSNAVTLTVNQIVGMEDPKNELVVYPSPARHWLYVKGDQELIERVEVRDNLGRVKVTPQPEQISHDVIAIDVRSLATGMYFLIVHYPGGSAVRKLMILAN